MQNGESQLEYCDGTGNSNWPWNSQISDYTEGVFGHPCTKFNLRIYLFKPKVILCQLNLFLVCSMVSIFTAKNTFKSHILCSVSCKKWREFRCSEDRIGWGTREVWNNLERACILSVQLWLSDFNANKCMGTFRHQNMVITLCRFTLFYIYSYISVRVVANFDLSWLHGNVDCYCWRAPSTCAKGRVFLQTVTCKRS